MLKNIWFHSFHSFIHFNTKYLHFRLISLSALCSYVFILSLTLALLAKRTNLSCKWVDVFSIAAQVFSNLFLKICPLFGQILIPCFSFSLVAKRCAGDEVDQIENPVNRCSVKCRKTYRKKHLPEFVFKWNSGLGPYNERHSTRYVFF